MAANSSRDRKWSDTDLTEAVAVSRNLLVSMPDGIKRVQVKTTTYNNKRGWMIQVGRRPYSIGNNARLVPYDPDLIDLFFIVDGDLTMTSFPARSLPGASRFSCEVTQTTSWAAPPGSWRRSRMPHDGPAAGKAPGVSSSALPAEANTR
jgi:hypothetical protein